MSPKFGISTDCNIAEKLEAARDFEYQKDGTKPLC